MSNLQMPWGLWEIREAASSKSVPLMEIMAKRDKVYKSLEIILLPQGSPSPKILKYYVPVIWYLAVLLAVFKSSRWRPWHYVSTTEPCTSRLFGVWMKECGFRQVTKAEESRWVFVWFGWGFFLFSFLSPFCPYTKSGRYMQSDHCILRLELDRQSAGKSKWNIGTNLWNQAERSLPWKHEDLGKIFLVY